MGIARVVLFLGAHIEDHDGMRVFDVGQCLRLPYRIPKPVEDRPQLPEGATPVLALGKRAIDPEKTPPPPVTTQNSLGALVPGSFGTRP